LTGSARPLQAFRRIFSIGLPLAGSSISLSRAAVDIEAYRRVAERMTRELEPAMVAITLRESISASDNGWSAVLWDGISHRWLREREVTSLFS
jgi:2-dehydro-3-deoxygluconokinase